MKKTEGSQAQGGHEGSRETHGRFTERIGGEGSFYFFGPFIGRIYTSLHLDEIPLFSQHH